MVVRYLLHVDFNTTHRLTGQTAGCIPRVKNSKMDPMENSPVATCSIDGNFIMHDDGKLLLSQESGHGIVSCGFLSRRGPVCNLRTRW